MSAAAVDASRIKAIVRSRLLAAAPAGRLDHLSPPERRLRVRQAVMQILREEGAILSAASLTAVVNQVSDEVVGLGPVERLLKDPEVSEVMVNGADDVYVERKGRIEREEGLVFEAEGERETPKTAAKPGRGPADERVGGRSGQPPSGGDSTAPGLPAATTQSAAI